MTLLGRRAARISHKRVPDGVPHRTRSRQAIAQPLQRGGRIVVKRRKEERALVVERFVEAAAGEPGPLDQVLDRGPVIAVAAEHLDGVTDRIVDVELARATRERASRRSRRGHFHHSAYMEPVVS